MAVMDAVRKTIPGKPIRYVINTHSHFDHAGGLRTYAAEGATIVTQAGNIPYYQQVWSNPRTIAPDRLAKSGRTPVFEGIVGSRTFRDDMREMVVYHYAGNMHNAGMLMVFLPEGADPDRGGFVHAGEQSERAARRHPEPRPVRRRGRSPPAGRAADPPDSRPPHHA